MKEKVGIIDVGGGMRGIYCAGVFDYLIDNKIELPYVMGISAGSANVASYIAKQKGRNKVFYEEYSTEKEYMSMHNFRTKGSYIDLDYVYGTLSNEDGKYPWDYNKAMESDSEMVVVASNAITAIPEYFYKKDFIKNDYGMFKASSCIPIICKPYKWRGKEYVDGAITAPIPIEKAFEDGCTRVIVLLTRPENFRKKQGKISVLYKKWAKKYPKITEQLYQRHILYNETLDKIEKEYVSKGKALIVAPDDCCGMDTLTKDKEKMEKMYNKGYNDGEKIKKFLLKNN